MLGDVFSNSHRSEEALKIFDFISAGYLQIFGTNDTVLNSYCVQQKGEAHFKTATERLQKPLKQGIEFALKGVEIMKAILDKENIKNNSVLAVRMQSLADGYRDMQDDAEAEKIYKECQTMVEILFGGDHPAMLIYNGNLVTCLSVRLSKKETTAEQKADVKLTIKNIIDKNYEVAKKTYGEDSIHFLF